MADLKIPNINMNSNKYIFKKKLSLRRKSKRRLFTESALMFILSLFLNVYEIFLVFFIFVSSFISLILMIGSVNRLFRVVKRKSKQIIYK